MSFFPARVSRANAARYLIFVFVFILNIRYLMNECTSPCSWPSPSHPMLICNPNYYNALPLFCSDNALTLIAVLPYCRIAQLHYSPIYPIALIQIHYNQQGRMIDEIIDFGNLSKKILVNPIVPLQLLNLKCRNSSRVQATLLGKVYSSHIEILEVIPVGLCDQNKVKTIDFQQHQRCLENIMSVYPTMQVLGVAVTDLKADINLAILHTMYANKESGFKVQGILSYPIILSVCTKITQNSPNFHIDAYCYNQVYKFCKEIMEVTAFEKLDASISLGDADFQSMTPLFQAVNDQEKIIPIGNAETLLLELVSRLKELKLRCDGQESSELKVKLREVVDRLNSKHQYSMEELSYLLDLAGLQKRIALKMNTFL